MIRIPMLPSIPIKFTVTIYSGTKNHRFKCRMYMYILKMETNPIKLQNMWLTQTAFSNNQQNFFFFFFGRLRH